MTQEEKQLLLKDLCARLPYGVKVKYLYWDENKGCEYPVVMVLDAVNSDGYIRFHGDIAEGEGRGMITQYLPYLRPMSSITEEEIDLMWQIYENSAAAEGSSRITDFLNERYLDHHHLIEKGLAIEAPEGMYKTE